jgi:hypothetical protein
MRLIMSAQGCARSNDRDLARLRLEPAGQVQSQRGCASDRQDMCISLDRAHMNAQERLSTGRLEVFRTLQGWLAEHCLCRRDARRRLVRRGKCLTALA